MPSDPKISPDWYPARIQEVQGNYRIQWKYLGEGKFDHAFYDDSLNAAFTHYQVSGFETAFEILDTLDDDESRLELGGLIFHASRCGSTLLSRMLSSFPGQVVLSEPPPIDDLFRSKLNQRSRHHYLKKLFRILLRRRSKHERHMIIKLNAWHTPAIRDLREVFPGVRFLFLYRNPLEILVSHRRQPGLQMVPGLIEPFWYGDSGRLSLELHPHEYAAWVLGRIMQFAVDQMDCGINLLNYTELADDGCARVPELLKLDTMWQHAQSVRNRHAKQDSVFTADTAVKQQQADEQMRSYCNHYTADIYHLLERMRLQRVLMN